MTRRNCPTGSIGSTGSMGARRQPSHRRERGVATPLVAISLVVLFIATSFTIDLGRLSERRRSMQLVADVAALDAARVLTQAPAADQYATVREAANRSAARNLSESGGAELEVVLLDAEGVELDEYSPVAPDAVSVRARDHVRFLFQPGGRAASARAIAAPANEPTAQLTLGTGLAAVGANPPGVAFQNALNGGLLGQVVSLDAVSYQGLATAGVTLGELAVAAGLGNDVDALLTTELSVAQLYDVALAALVNQGADESAILALDALRAAAEIAPALSPVRLADLLVVEPGTPVARYASVELGIDRLVQGALLLGHQGSVVSIPSLNATIPGLTNLQVQLGVIEPAQTVIGPIGTTVKSAQVRLAITLDVQPLGLPLIHVPLVVEAAAAQATIVNIVCQAGTAIEASVHVQTTGASIALGRVDNLAADGDPVLQPAVIAPLGLLQLTAATRVPINGYSGAVAVAADDWGTLLRVGGPVTLGRSELATGLSLGGIPLQLGLIDGLVGAVLDGVLVPTTNLALGTIVEPLLDLLGAQLAYADLTVSNPQCNTTTPRLLA